MDFDHVMRIAIIGPECSGKTTLAQELADALQCPWVPEYARAYFEDHPWQAYTLADIVAIAQGQQAQEDRLAHNTPYLICDTTVLVCQIWARVRYRCCPKSLTMLYHAKRYALQFVTKPDIPWVPDPLRQNPYDRDRLFTYYLRALQADGSAYVVLQGNRRRRLSDALSYIGRLQNSGVELYPF